MKKQGEVLPEVGLLLGLRDLTPARSTKTLQQYEYVILATDIHWLRARVFTRKSGIYTGTKLKPQRPWTSIGQINNQHEGDEISKRHNHAAGRR